MQVLSWGTTLFVLRYLTPADYGVAGMAALWVALASLASEAGIPGTVVASPDLRDGDFAALNSRAVLFGAVASLGSLILGGPLAALLHEPGLASAIAVMGVILVLDGVRMVPAAVLQRRLEFRQTALVQGARSLVSTVVVLSSAILGLGYWALILGAVAGSLAAAAVAVLACHVGFARPSFGGRELTARYARTLMFTRIVTEASRKGDFVVVSGVLGSSPFGHYSLAWSIAAQVGEKLTNLLTIVSSPFFASLRDDRAALRRYLLLLTEGIGMLTLPALAGIAFVAADAVVVFWGARWAPAILPTRLLVGYAIVNALGTPLPQILVATGQLRATRRNALFTMLITLPAFFIAARLWGMAAVAAAWLFLYPVAMARPFRLVMRTLSIPLGEYLGALRPSVTVTAAMLAVLVAVRMFVTASLAPDNRLWIEILVGAATASIVFASSYRERLLATWRALRSAPHSRVASAPPDALARPS